MAIRDLIPLRRLSGVSVGSGPCDRSVQLEMSASPFRRPDASANGASRLPLPLAVAQR